MAFPLGLLQGLCSFQLYKLHECPEGQFLENKRQNGHDTTTLQMAPQSSPQPRGPSKPGPELGQGKDRPALSYSLLAMIWASVPCGTWVRSRIKTGLGIGSDLRVHTGMSPSVENASANLTLKQEVPEWCLMKSRAQH